MNARDEISRRHLLAAMGCLSLSSHLMAVTVEDKQKLPIVTKRAEKAFKSPGEHPNALEAVPDGLWILDQADPNKVHKVSYTDGSVLVEIQTESIHGSGIAYGDGALWIASTNTLKTLKVDPKTGKTLASFDTPGVGYNKFGRNANSINPNRRMNGAHGLQWVDGRYWITTPASEKIFLVEPETGRVLRDIPAPGVRPHGLAWDNGFLWCVESNDRAIYKLDSKDGKLVAKIQLTNDDPEPHGLAMNNGVFWYCDAETQAGWVCRLA